MVPWWERRYSGGEILLTASNQSAYGHDVSGETFELSHLLRGVEPLRRREFCGVIVNADIKLVRYANEVSQHRYFMLIDSIQSSRLDY